MNVRRTIFTATSALLLSVLVVSLAGAATKPRAIKHATLVRCGGLYQPHCAPPRIPTVSPAVTCHPASSPFLLPAFTVRGVAGLKRITITLTGRSHPFYSRNLNGATSRRISGVLVNPKGLSSGAHSVTIKLVDERGKSVTAHARFAVCAPPAPPFTG